MTERIRPVLIRVAAMVAVTILTVGLLNVRTTTVGVLYRQAAGPSADGGFYLVDPQTNDLFRFAVDGSQRRVGRLPGFIALSMAVQGLTLLVGSEQGLYRSDDGGVTWRPAGPRGLHFTAVSMAGDLLAAADWGSAIWVSTDAGRTWSRAGADPADLQVNQLLIGTDSAWLAATEVGLLRSSDQGRTWRRVPAAPDRLTAFGRIGSRVLAGTWDGRLLSSTDDGLSWTQERRFKSGIWWIGAGGLVATAVGLFEEGMPASAPITGLEMVEAERVGQSTFAIQPGPKLWLRPEGAGWRRIFPD